MHAHTWEHLLPPLLPAPRYVSSYPSALLGTRSLVSPTRPATGFLLTSGVPFCVGPVDLSYRVVRAVHQNRDGGGRVLAEGAGAAVLQTFRRRRGVFVTTAVETQQ